MNNIYIVDDDDAVSDSLSMLLSLENFNVIVFSSPIDFVERVAKLPNGCIILDLCMPGMSGMQVMEYLKKQIILMPVICITGHGDVPTAVKALKIGAYDFLEKPFDSTLLIETIRLCIEKQVSEQYADEHKNKSKEAVASLTPREHEVLSGMVEGLRNKQIAYNMGISIRTVELHRVHVMEKLNAKSLSDVLKIAISAGHSYLYEMVES